MTAGSGKHLHHRVDCLDYPAALPSDLPIGSGMNESDHRHLLQARLKMAGTTWLPDHAGQITHLHANDQWLSLWNAPPSLLITPQPTKRDLQPLERYTHDW